MENTLRLYFGSMFSQISLRANLTSTALTKRNVRSLATWEYESLVARLHYPRRADRFSNIHDERLHLVVEYRAEKAAR